ncbi:hypothetical protein AGMMS49975_06800 [Clostridia bacterium]|nr:hypothetical protein AGMMS49975_06800 [Clostridia bacterium]
MTKYELLVMMYSLQEVLNDDDKAKANEKALRIIDKVVAQAEDEKK